MLKSIKEFFESRTGSASQSGHTADNSSLELAAAVLMVEISLADSEIQDEEREVIINALENQFHLPAEDTETIFDLATREADHAVSLHGFTSLLNKTMSYEEKVKIIELLWHVAYADAVLDKYEEYFVRKISDLLYVSHSDYIKAKHRATEQL